MSDTNTTPDNIIPITPEVTPEAPVGFSPNDQGLPSASDVSAIPAVEQTAENDPVQQVIQSVDLSKMTKDDIFVDMIHQSKLYAFRLMVGAALLEKLIIKGQEEAAAAAGTTGDEKPEVE